MLLLFLVAAVLVPALVSAQYVLLALSIVISLLVGLSFNVLFGYAGMFSFGQSAFYGLGAYGTALLMGKVGFGFYPALIAGAAMAATLAILVGPILVRLDPIAFIMLTFALGDLMGFAVLHLNGLSGGDSGYIATLPSNLSVVVSPSRVYYVVLGAAVVAVLMSRWFVRSSAGLIVQGIRDDEARARTIGVNVVRWRILAFAFASAIAGLAGGLSVLSSQIVYPSVFSWQISTSALIVVLLGGVGRFIAPIVGALLLGLIEFYAGRLTTDIQLVDGLIFLFIVLVAPQGVVPLVQDLVVRLRHRTRGRADSGAGRPTIVEERLLSSDVGER